MPVPTPASFIGVAKESVRGTALAPTAYIPVTSFDSPNDQMHTVPDTGYRGAPVESYDQLPTQAWAEPTYGGNVHVDTIGYWLHCLLGEKATTGPVSGVYSHVFNLYNGSDFQPPSYCITDFNGVDTRQIAAFLVSELALTFTASGLLTYTVKGMGLKSTTTTKPTPSYTAERAVQSWTGVTTIAGSVSSIMQDGSITLSRAVEVIPRIGSQDPYRIWGGAVGVKGAMNLVYESSTELNRYLNGTSTTVDILFGTGIAGTLRQIEFNMGKCLYTAGKPTRSKSYAELPIQFEADANTTDIGVSGGYGPVLVGLWNTLATY